MSMRGLLFLVLLVVAPVCGAQTAQDTNEGLRLLRDGVGSTFNLSWWGRTGRTYFVQESDDLLQWHYVPVVDSGADAPLSYGFELDGPRSFFRLRWSEASPNDPENSDFDGDGVPDLVEIAYASYGYDPLDYYNGAAPTLKVVMGAGQWGAPGQVLAVPVSVQANNGSYNAPLTLSVMSGGALLSTDAAGASGWSSTLTLRTTSAMANGGMFQTFAAQVYVKLSMAAGDVSTLKASAESGAQTSSTQMWVGSHDSSLGTITAFTATPTSSSTVRLNWTSSSPELATLVEFSQDNGNNWSVLGVVPVASSSTVVTNMPSDEIALFRVHVTRAAAEEGYNGTLNMGGLAGGGGGFSFAPKEGASAASSQEDATPVSRPLLLAEQAEIDQLRYGYPGLQSASMRYLKIDGTHKITPTGLPPTLNVTYSTSIDPRTGSESLQGDTGYMWVPGGGGAGVSIESDTDAKLKNESANGIKEEGTYTLSDPYPMSDFIQKVESWVPPFTGDPIHSYGAFARLWLSPENASGGREYLITKLRYRWKINEGDTDAVLWDATFTPFDAQGHLQPDFIEHNLMSWTTASATKSPVFTIDPIPVQDKPNGFYEVNRLEVEFLTPDHVPDPEADDQLPVLASNGGSGSPPDPFAGGGAGSAGGTSSGGGTSTPGPVTQWPDDKYPITYGHVSELRVAKMEQSLDSADALEPGDDPDHFLIQIRGLGKPANGATPLAIWAELQTTDSPATIRPDLVANHDHGATMIKLTYHAKDDGSDGYYRSRPLVLVSNKDDDTHVGAVNIPTDRSVDDPTHITALGGKVKVVRVTTGAGWFAAHCEATVKKRRQVWVKQWVLSDAGLTDASKNITSPRPDLDFITAQERFAQVGVELIRESAPTVLDVAEVFPSGTGSSIEVATPTNSPSLLAKAIIDAAKQKAGVTQNASLSSKDHVNVFYCLGLRKANQDAVWGYSTIEQVCQFPSDQMYANNAFLALTAQGVQVRDLNNIMAHEIGHLLTNLTHYGVNYGTEVNTPWLEHRMKHNLMWRDVGTTAGWNGQVRLYKKYQQEAIEARLPAIQ